MRPEEAELLIVRGIPQMLCDHLGTSALTTLDLTHLGAAHTAVALALVVHPVGDQWLLNDMNPLYAVLHEQEVDFSIRQARILLKRRIHSLVAERLNADGGARLCVLLDLLCALVGNEKLTIEARTVRSAIIRILAHVSAASADACQMIESYNEGLATATLIDIVQFAAISGTGEVSDTFSQVNQWLITSFRSAD